jgi:hypothetical protein
VAKNNAPSARAIDAAKRLAKSGGGSAGMLPHPAGIAFRHLEKRGEAVSFAVGGSPASAHALQLARCNNPNPPYQTPNELSHDPPQLFDDNYRWPFRKTSDPQRRDGRTFDDAGALPRTSRIVSPIADHAHWRKFLAKARPSTNVEDCTAVQCYSHDRFVNL